MFRFVTIIENMKSGPKKTTAVQCISCGLIYSGFTKTSIEHDHICGNSMSGKIMPGGGSGKKKPT